MRTPKWVHWQHVQPIQALLWQCCGPLVNSFQGGLLCHEREQDQSQDVVPGYISCGVTHINCSLIHISCGPNYMKLLSRPHPQKLTSCIWIKSTKALICSHNQPLQMLQLSCSMSLHHNQVYIRLSKNNSCIINAATLCIHLDKYICHMHIQTNTCFDFPSVQHILRGLEVRKTPEPRRAHGLDIGNEGVVQVTTIYRSPKQLIFK